MTSPTADQLAREGLIPELSIRDYSPDPKSIALALGQPVPDDDVQKHNIAAALNSPHLQGGRNVARMPGGSR